MLGSCDDLSPLLPFLLSVMVDRANCQDLEGILNLPEVMRPPPSQKPRRLVKFNEESEEVALNISFNNPTLLLQLRLSLCELMHTLVSLASSDQIYDHLDDVCNVLRAFAMDPFGEIQLRACQTIGLFAKKHTDILLHFSEILARSILLPLISKKSRIRVAALRCLGQILYCGIWKYNAFIFEILVGFRDPNSVPIKAFYEPMNNINYFATLITDPKP